MNNTNTNELIFPWEKCDTSIPIVAVSHNNITLNLMVDTGCNTSYIDESIIDLLLVNKTEHLLGGIVFGDGSTEQESPIYEIPLALGDFKFTEEFAAINLSSTVKEFQDAFGIKIRGMLGSDFLTKYGFMLDFKNKNIHIINGNNRQVKLDFESSESSKEAN